MTSADNYIFKVQVLEGRGFGEEPKTLVCCAAFAGETKTTQYSVNTDAHIWNSTLTWSLSRDELRRAQASGSSHCKVTVLRKDGTKLGWLVVSLRSAKLQSQYKSDPQGKWMQLNATKLSDPPQLRIAYSLCDERSVPQLLEPSSSQVSLSQENSSAAGPTSANSSRRVSSSQHASAAASLRPSKNRRSSSTSATLQPSASYSSVNEQDDALPHHDCTHPTEAAAVDALAADNSTASLQVSSLHAQDSQQRSQHILSPKIQNEHHQQQLNELEVVMNPQQEEQRQLQHLQRNTATTVTDTNAAGDSADQPSTFAGGHSRSSSGVPQLQATATIASHSSPDRPAAAQHEQEAVVCTASSPCDDAIAAAEASLPTFAQRRQLQQQQQQQMQVEASVALAGTATLPPASSELMGASEDEVVPRHAAPPAPQAAVAAAVDVVQANAPAGDAVPPMQPQQQRQEQATTLSLHAPPAQHHDAAQPLAAPPDRSAVVTESTPPTSKETSTASTSLLSSKHNAEDGGRDLDPQQSASTAGPAAADNAGPRHNADDPSSSAPALAANGTAASPVEDVAAVAAANPVRQFVFTLDVRSFQAGRRLPIALSSTYVQAFLPQELLGFLTTDCNAKIPPRLTPLRTLPAVDVMRGSEGALPNGCACVEFAAGVMGLAELLAKEPRVVLEVWHKEKLRSDLLLGVASVSLSALLQECWVDGYAPVYAMMAKATQGADDQQEKVQVGLLRVVLSLEDKGVAATVATTAASASPASAKQLQRNSSSSTVPMRSPNRTAPKNQLHAPAAGNKNSSSAVPLPAPAGPYAQRQQQLQKDMAAAAGAPERKQHADTDGDAAAQVVVTAEGVTASAAGDFRQLPEYLVAWELEVWKKAEEARFRAQLKELEQQRMSVIEQQWWKRERAREAETAAVKAEYAKLEQQTKALLAAVQEREVKVLAAEADLARRRSDLERQQAARMSEAEAAVRRLQVECEHQLALERDRTAAVARQRDAAEARLLAAEARAAALEAQFTEYRAAQRATPEAQLQLQLQEAQAAAARAEDRANRALKVKKQYKQQVLQLARELAQLHQQRQEDALRHLEQQQAAAAAQEQSRQDAAQQAELSALKDQLAQLKSATLAAMATAAQAAATSPAERGVDAPDVSRRQRRKQHRHRPDKENYFEGDHAQQNQQGCAAQLGRMKSSELEQMQRQQRQRWQQQSIGDEQQYSDSSTDESQQWDNAAASYSSSSSSSEECSDQDDVQHSRTRQRQRFRGSKHVRQQQRWQHGTAEGVHGSTSGSGPVSAADAALAEVAALAAILNQPRPSSAKAGASGTVANEQQQQQQQEESPQTPTVEAVESTVQHLQPQQQSSQPYSAAENAASLPPDSHNSAKRDTGGLNPLSEVRRLLKEKVELLASGLYDRNDPVVLQIDARVQVLAEQQLAA